MSLPVLMTTEADGTLRYGYQDLAVRVGLHKRAGTKKYPVELLLQGQRVVSTDANLRELRDIQPSSSTPTSSRSTPTGIPC
jgi:hypothetical protein